jgi:hypothetical protein
MKKVTKIRGFIKDGTFLGQLSFSPPPQCKHIVTQYGVAVDAVMDRILNLLTTLTHDS